MAQEVKKPEKPELEFDYSKYGFRDEIEYKYIGKPGLSRELIEEISHIKGEPDWMREIRLKAYEHFIRRPMPTWGPDLSEVERMFDKIIYYASPTDPNRKARSWEDVPDSIKRTFERLGVPEAERKWLAGLGAQYDSEVVYHRVREDLEKKGVIFVDMDTAVREYPDLVREYFGTVVPYSDNKFAALNTAVWSGGSFVYVPAGVEVDFPLQAYFRINLENFGQFERTLIIVEEGAKVHYIEGCTAPIYSSGSLHSAVVEVIAKRGSHVRYTTIQNWAKHIYNLVTKRAVAYRDAFVEWVNGELGCLTGDSYIFKNNDVVPIKDINVGDYVWSLTPDMKIVRSRVVGKKVNPPRPVYRLLLQNGREVKATDNHPFLVLRKVGKLLTLGWMPLRDIREGDYVAIAGRIPDHGKPYAFNFTPERRGNKPVKLPERTTEDLMWLLGFYLGDGYTDDNRVYFAVPEDDPAEPKVRRTFEDVFGIKLQRRGVVLRTGSVEIVDFIRSIGLGGNARTKRVPDWVYTLPENQRKAFIQGYIDADGHVRKDHKNLTITSANRELLEQIKLLAMSVGMNPTKITRHVRKEKLPLGKKEKTYITYFLHFSKEEINAPVHFVKVSKVEYVGEEVTYDIEVEGTANFIANGIFAHNSKVTMKYPGVILKEPGARMELLTVSYAGKGQIQDSGAKAIHLAPYTTSTITSKSISKDGGRATYRGLLKVVKGAHHVKSTVQCDALLLDPHSRTDTYPYIEIEEENVHIGHEATVGKIGSDQLFYLMSRGLSEAEAYTLIVLGFIEPFTKTLPMEYAVELNRLIELEMEGSVG